MTRPMQRGGVHSRQHANPNVSAARKHSYRNIAPEFYLPRPLQCSLPGGLQLEWACHSQSPLNCANINLFRVDKLITEGRCARLRHYNGGTMGKGLAQRRRLKRALEAARGNLHKIAVRYGLSLQCMAAYVDQRGRTTRTVHADPLGRCPFTVVPPHRTASHCPAGTDFQRRQSLRMPTNCRGHYARS